MKAHIRDIHASRLGKVSSEEIPFDMESKSIWFHSGIKVVHISMFTDNNVHIYTDKKPKVTEDNEYYHIRKGD